MSEVVSATETDTELDAIIEELDREYRGFPAEAIAAARRHGGTIVPRLIELLEVSADIAVDDVDLVTNGPLYALHLLAEFRAKEALPAILKVVTLPRELTYDILGDSLHEHVPRVLAALADTTDVFDRMISDRTLNEYVRSAAMSAYLESVFDGKLSRTDAVEKLRRHLAAAIADRDSEGVSWLVCALINYSPEEAMNEIREAYRQNLVDTSLIDLRSFEEVLADGRLEFGNKLEEIAVRRLTLPLEQIEEWCRLNDESGARAAARASEQQRVILDSVPRTRIDSRRLDFQDHDFSRPVPEAGTIRYSESRVGRNDPCPCGSGRKYKKCCGAN